MAEFGYKATELSGPSMAGAQPLQPISQNQSGTDLSGLSGLANALTGLFNQPPKDPLAETENKYAQGVANLQQMVDTGQIAPQEFEKRRVSLFREISVNDGAKYGVANVYKRLGKFHKETEDASGVSDYQKRGQSIAEAEEKLISQGIAEGFFTPEFVRDPAARQMALNIIQDKLYTDDQIRRKKEQNDLIRQAKTDKQNDIKFDQGQIDYERKEVARSHLLNNGDAFNKSFDLMVTQGRQRIAKGEDPKIVWTELQQSLNAQSSAFNLSMADSPEAQKTFATMANSLSTFAQTALDPTKISAFDDATLKINITAAQQSIIQNKPEMLTLAGAVKLAGPTAATNAALNMHGADIVMGLFAGQKGQAAPMVREGKTEAQKVVNSAVDEIFSKNKLGTADKGAVEQATSLVNGVLRGIGESKPTDGVSLNEALKTMAGPSVKAMIENKSLDVSSMMEARMTYENYIRKDLYNRGMSVFNTPIELGGKSYPPAAFFKIETDDSGNIKAVPNPLFDLKIGDGERIKAMQTLGVELNKINKNLGDFSMILRVETHSMGRTDYPKVLEEFGGKIFPNIFVSKELLEQARANGYEYNGGDTADRSSWIRRKDGTDAKSTASK